MQTYSSVQLFLKKIREKNLSLSKDYFIFSTIIFVGITTTIFFVTWNSYQSYLDKMNGRLEESAETIAQKIDVSFEDLSQVLAYLGKEIVKHGNPKDPSHILSVLKNAKSIEIIAIKHLADIYTFDWIDRNNRQIINIKEGILTHPHDMSHRDYITTVKQHPWTLHISKPAIGIPSGLWVIPIGFGVTDETDQYIGSISSGIIIHSFAKYIKKHMREPLINFFVFDYNFNLVLDSSSPKLKHVEDTSWEAFITRLKQNVKGSSALFLPAEHNNIVYSYYQKTNRCPFIIIVGFDRRVINKEFRSMVLPKIVEFFGIGTFCLMLLFVFRRKIANPINRLSNLTILLSKGVTNLKVPRQNSLELHNLAKTLLQIMRYIKRHERGHNKLKEIYDLAHASDNAREVFIRQTDNELTAPKQIILHYTNLLIHISSHKINIPHEEETMLLMGIKEAALNLQTLTSDIFNFSHINLNNIIEDSLIIKAKEAFLKNITIHTDLEKNLPPIYADPLRLKQIIVGILSLSIDYLSKGGNIRLSSFLGDTKGKKFFKVILTDNGISLDKKEMAHLSKTNYNKLAYRSVFDRFSLTFELIEKLIKLHKGTLDIEKGESTGKSIVLWFPCENLL